MKLYQLIAGITVLAGFATFILTLNGCGYSAVHNTLTGQAKKVVRSTPLLCPDYSGVDVSLGVMRNGVGSLSTQDQWLVLTNPEQEAILVDAVAKGSIVEITYDTKRFAFCTEDFFVREVRVVEP